MVGFGLVACAISFQFLATSHAPASVAVRSSLRDWMPWIALTPLLFRLAARFPIGRQPSAVALLEVDHKFGVAYPKMLASEGGIG